MAYNGQKVQRQKDKILQKLKERGYRITRQRKILLDIILEQNCSCCKEIYFRASKLDSKIGSATVYRMLHTLEEVGAINRENIYKIVCKLPCEIEKKFVVELDDHTICHLSAKDWNLVVLEGLKICGYIKEQKVKNVIIQSNVCDDENK